MLSQVSSFLFKFGDKYTSLDNAIISVMAFRMMHFGTTKTPKLPVTISFSDRISGFVRRGIKPSKKTLERESIYRNIILNCRTNNLKSFPASLDKHDL